MTTPTGVIKASDIRSEFGATSGDQNTGPVSLGAYRISQTVSGMSGLSLDNEYDSSGKIIKLIPQGTNAISFDNLRGRRLNIVVDYGTTKGTRSAETRYDNGTGVTIIGGFKTTRPSKGTGTKVWIHTNGTVSSDGNGGSGRTYCSMYTGSGWNSTTLLRIDITGLVIGAGGNGGNGGSAYHGDITASATAGSDGTSAIGINTPCSVIVSNRGRIAGGGGGGGGGGAALANTWSRGYNADGFADAGGSGGGGGAGSPVGTKGSAGTGGCYYRCGSTDGNAGEDGLSITSGGKGGTANGVGGGNDSSATGGAGGNGGGQGGDGSTGGKGSASGSTKTSTPDGGSPGKSGYAVVTSNASLDIRGTAGIYDFVGGTATSTQLT